MTPFPSEAHWQAILKSIPDAVYVGTADGIKIANEPALSMLGFHSLEELNRSVAELASCLQTRYFDTGAVISAEDQGYSHALHGLPGFSAERFHDLRSQRVLQGVYAGKA